jgi:hypothetical protein
MAGNIDNDDGWVYPRSHPYQPYMVEFMRFFTGEDFPDDQVFTREQLLEIKPMDIKAYLCMKAYGDPWPDIDGGARPTNGRSDGAAFAKKALSYYMPHKNAAWCNGQGNPTKSTLVNEMIKQVKKFEVRGEGKDSNAKRPLKQSEFRMTLQLLKAKDDWKCQRRYPMMALWQYHLIGRVDDVANFKTSDPRGHGDYDFALKTKVRWSKNVMEERQCPPQILLGSMDPMFCLLLNFAVYLEDMLGHYPNCTYLFTDNNDEKAPKNLITTYRNTLERIVWKNEQFKALETEDDEEGVGTHSYRKHPSNFARGCGANPDEIEIRGRWKTQGKRVVFRYIDVKQLSIDAKVAGMLCVGGPIAYRFKAGVNLTDDWLFEHVVPNIRQRYPNDSRLCRVLATALLFGAMDNEIGEAYLPQAMRDRITQAYIPTHPTIAQPVTRVPLNIYRIEDNLMIDLLHGLADDAAAGVAERDNGAPVAGGRVGAAALAATDPTVQAILVNIQQVRQQEAQHHQQNQDSISGLRAWATDQFRKVNNNIRAFGGTIQGGFARQDPQQQAHRRQAQDQQEQVQQDGLMPATLAPTPRTLAELWEEYQFGIGGRKAAKDWTAAERGNTRDGIKQKYYRRKFVWWTIEELIRSGLARNVAIERIRSAYGHRCSVTQIINFLIHDHTGGRRGHANLVDLTPRLRTRAAVVPRAPIAPARGGRHGRGRGRGQAVAARGRGGRGPARGGAGRGRGRGNGGRGTIQAAFARGGGIGHGHVAGGIQRMEV